MVKQLNKKAQGGLLVIIILCIVLYLVFSGSGTSSQTGAIEVYMTDANNVEDVSDVQFRIMRVDAINEQNQAKNMFVGDMAFKLNEQLMQKIAGQILPEDKYVKLKIQFAGEAALKFKDGTIKTVQVNNPVWEVDLNEEVLDDETTVVIIDLPIENTVTEVQEGQFKVNPGTPYLQVMKKAMVRERVREMVGEPLSNLDANGNGVISLEELEMKLEQVRQENQNQINCPTYEEPGCENGQIVYPGKVGNCDLPPICKVQSRGQRW